MAIKWTGNWTKKAVLVVFCVSALLLLIGEGRAGFKGDVLRHIEGVSFDSAHPQTERREVKRFSEHRQNILSDSLEAEISFSMRVYSIGAWNNVFQTAPLNQGIRLELAQPSTLGLLVAHKSMGLLGLPMTSQLELNRWYDVKVRADKSHGVEAYLDGKLVGSSHDPNVDFNVTDIAVGQGFSTERTFSGEIKDFSLTLTGPAKAIPGPRSLPPLVAFLLVGSALAILVITLKVRFTVPPSGTADLQHLAAFFSILAAGVLYASTAYLIATVYRPDIASLMNEAAALLHRPYYLPEPTERLQFFGGLVCLPIFLYVFYFVFSTLMSKWSATIERYASEAWLLSSLVLALTFAALLTVHDTHYDEFQHFGHLSYFEEYFRPFQFKTPLAIGIGAFLVVSILLIRSWTRGVALPNTRWIQALCWSGFALSLYLAFTANLVDLPAQDCAAYHFNAVHYSLSQVMAGVPMLVDSFTNTYGLYPHFIAPVLRFFEPTIMNVTCAFAVLVAASFAFLYLFLSRAVHNRGIAFIGFISVLWNGYFQHKPPVSFVNEGHQSYYQFYPLRTLFPFMALYLTARYVQSPSTALRVICFALYALGILWNPESGALVFVAWLSLLCFEEVASRKVPAALAGIAKHVVVGFGVAAAVMAAFCVAFRIGYGTFPDLISLFSSLAVFTKVGYAMVPMPAFHPWLLYVFTGAVGLMIALRSLAARSVSENDKCIFFTSVLALGFMSYYQGRSLTYAFDSISGYFFLLLVLFTDRAYRAIEQTTYQASSLKARVAFFALFLTISIPLGSIVTNYGEIFAYYRKTNNGLRFFLGDRSRLYTFARDPDVTFIRAHTHAGEKVLFLGGVIMERRQGIYLAGSETVSAFNPGWVELFLKKDYQRLLSILRSGKHKVFVGKDFAPSEEVKGILAERYARRSQNENLTYFEQL